MRGKLKYLKFWRIWRPTVRRFGRKGALVLLGIPTALIIGSAAYASLLLATGGGSINLQNGLVAYYKLNGNGVDSSPYGNNGTVNGTTATTDRQGNTTGALSFNGTSDYIDLGNPSQLQITGSQTISMWVKPASFSARENPYAKAYGGEGTITQETNGTLHYYYGTSGGNTTPYTSIGTNSALALNQWSLITIVRDLSTMKLTWYINGSQDNQIAAPYSAATASSFNAFIGKGYVSNYDGSIDDFRMYDRALSADEVAALYQDYNPQVNAASGENGLIGQWKLNGNPKDSTPYAHDGTISGTPTATTDREGDANGAYSFGGTDYLQMSGGSFFNVDAGQAKTYSIWFKGSTPAQTENFYWEQGGCIGWQFSALTNGDIQFGLTTGNNGCTGYNSYAVQTSTSYTDNNWHLATAVVDRPGGNEYLYIDGVLKATHVVDNTYSGVGGTFRIGTNYNNTHGFIGSLADARVYSRALSQSDISHLYDSYNSQINLYSSAASGGGGADISSGLVGEWNFTGNARDATPYSDNGTVTGATLTADRFGSLNSAYSFNGTNQYINLGNPSVLNITGDITINAWIYLNTTAQAAIVTWANSYSNFPYHFVTTGSNPPKLRFNRTSYSKDSGSSFSTGAWTMVTVTVSGNQLNYYFNAVPDSSNPQTTSGTVPSGDGYLTISRNGTQNFNGSIDDIRIYNRALSAADIQALYNLN